jgi:hypothetical protein
LDILLRVFFNFIQDFLFALGIQGELDDEVLSDVRAGLRTGKEDS